MTATQEKIGNKKATTQQRLEMRDPLSLQKRKKKKMEADDKREIETDGCGRDDTSDKKRKTGAPNEQNRHGKHK